MDKPYPKEFRFFDGQHCETVTAGSLLLPLGISLSEPMLFGLGEGLGFLYWKNKQMEFPFLGGRVKPDQLTRNLAANLGLEIQVRETRSPRKAWEGVRHFLDQGESVGLKLDSYYLDYFEPKVHFAAHYVAIYAYDHQNAYLIDTRAQGGRVKTSLASLAEARAAKGPMSSAHLYFTLRPGPREKDIRPGLETALRNNALQYLQPPIANLGYRGIEKASREIPRWIQETEHPFAQLGSLARLMEEGGTGGALFRNFYRDFLREAHGLLGNPILGEACAQFEEIARDWKEVYRTLMEIAESQDRKAATLLSEQLQKISRREKQAMTLISRL